jgi:hypothetical protein
MLFERLLNMPFWIWNIEEHKQEDIKSMKKNKRKLEK